MKYTKSVDGEMRITLRGDGRFTKEQSDRLRAIAKDQGCRSFKIFLNHCFLDGIHAAIDEDDQDPTDANTGENS